VRPWRHGLRRHWLGSDGRLRCLWCHWLLLASHAVGPWWHGGWGRRRRTVVLLVAGVVDWLRRSAQVLRLAVIVRVVRRGPSRRHLLLLLLLGRGLRVGGGLGQRTGQRACVGEGPGGGLRGRTENGGGRGRCGGRVLRRRRRQAAVAGRFELSVYGGRRGVILCSARAPVAPLHLVGVGGGGGGSGGGRERGRVVVVVVRVIGISDVVVLVHVGHAAGIKAAGMQRLDGLGGLLRVLVVAVNVHLLEPLLHHFVDQSVVADEAPFVLGFVLALGTFVGGSLGAEHALTQPLPEMAVRQMSQQHVSAGKVAGAQRTAFPIGIVGLEALQNVLVETVEFSRPFVQVFQHHFVVESVVSGQQLVVLSLEGGAVGTLEGRMEGQVGAQPVQKMLVRAMPQKVSGVEKSRVANGAGHRVRIPAIRILAVVFPVVFVQVVQRQLVGLLL